MFTTLSSTNNATVMTVLTAKITIVVINKVARATVTYRKNGQCASYKTRCNPVHAQNNDGAFTLCFTDALAHLPKAAKVAVSVTGNIPAATREQLSFRPTLVKSSTGIVHQLA